MTPITGSLEKMRVRLLDDHAHYTLALGERGVELNPLLGERVALEFSGRIHCVACGRATRKSFSQGYCFGCAQSLAECDLCIVSPEKCHLAHGTCRDAAWAEAHCQQEHVVYLSNTSGLKVGITRATQMPTRWLDQGATQALPILRVRTRHHSGLAEAMLRAHVADRTQWRQMLQGEPQALDLRHERERLLGHCADALDELRATFGAESFIALTHEEERRFVYPVLHYPNKVSALSFDKRSGIEGTLLGIKGQYLILDTGVVNIRKHRGYEVRLAA